MVRNIEVQNTFSGPLDLLLYLVRRDEIDIHDIPVGHVTKEYLIELNKMQEVDVDAGGEFLAMASMLTEIKGRMLLPDVSEEEEEEEDIYDPRQGLIEALLEYKKFKEVAAELETMSTEFDSRYSRIVKEPEFQAVVKEKAEELGALDLLAAFQRIARRMLNERAPREIVSEEVPTEVRIKQIEEVVDLRGRVSFSSILSDSPTEDEMVGFFIAMLELIRMRKIEAQQAIDFSEIYFIPVFEEKVTIEEILPSKIQPVVEEKNINNTRLTRSGLSSIFSFGKRSNTKIINSRNSIVNKFDTFAVLKRNKMHNEKVILPDVSAKFPPLIKSSFSKNILCIKQSKLKETVAVTNKIEILENRENSFTAKNKRFEFKLSDPFVIYNSKMGINAEDISNFITNKFNTLTLKKVTKKSINEKKTVFQSFMQLIFGKICKNKIDITSDIHIRNSINTNIYEHQSITSIKRVGESISFANKNMLALFPLKQRVELLSEAKKIARRSDIFELFKLNRVVNVKSNEKAKYNSLKFLPLSTNNALAKFPHIISMSCQEEDIVEDISINPVQSDSFLQYKKKNPSLKVLSPFLMLAKKILNTKERKSFNKLVVDNKFKLFNSKYSLKNYKTNLIFKKNNNFMQIMSGKIVIHENKFIYEQAVIHSFNKSQLNVGTKHKVKNASKSRSKLPLPLFSLNKSSAFKLCGNFESKNKFDVLLFKHNKICCDLKLKKNFGFLTLAGGCVEKNVTKKNNASDQVLNEIKVEEKCYNDETQTLRQSFKLSNVFGTKVNVNSSSVDSKITFDFMLLKKNKVIKSDRTIRGKYFLKL